MKAAIDRLREKAQNEATVFALNDECRLLRAELEAVKRERDELHQICRDAYEVWAGSEGIPEPVYASEAYLYQLLINMRDEVKRGLTKVGAGETGEQA